VTTKDGTFPNIEHPVCARWVAKVEKRMREEDGFIEKLMGVEKNLVEGRKRKIKK